VGEKGVNRPGEEKLLVIKNEPCHKIKENEMGGAR
jgi:hypothetical protein